MSYKINYVGYIIALLSLSYLDQFVDSHGTLIDPVSRNSLWRIDKRAPVNYNDIELFCGGIGVSIDYMIDMTLV